MSGTAMGRTAMGRTAWFQCASGVAGDMVLASLLDAGASLDEVESMLGRLHLPGWRLRVEDVTRAGLVATRAVVEVSERGEIVPRHLVEIDALLRQASLPERVEQRARASFEVLANAEARVHGCSPSEVHFHEAGGHDAIVEVVGTAAALEVLAVDHVASSAVALGSGRPIASRRGLHAPPGTDGSPSQQSGAAHPHPQSGSGSGSGSGSHPELHPLAHPPALANPAPAVLELLACGPGDGIPAYGVDTDVELTTPTGAALLAAMAGTFGPLPLMTVLATGRGAGTADPPGFANCLEVVIGSTESSSGQREMLSVVETNVDDASGEVLAHAVRALLEAGALDAWVTPAIMKKGRPGNIVHVLGRAADIPALRDCLLAETGSLGARSYSVERYSLERSIAVVEVAGMQVRMKVAGKQAKPEYEDAARVAAANGLPLRQVMELAMLQWHSAGARTGRTGQAAPR